MCRHNSSGRIFGEPEMDVDNGKGQRQPNVSIEDDQMTRMVRLSSKISIVEPRVVREMYTVVFYWGVFSISRVTEHQ